MGIPETVGWGLFCIGRGQKLDHLEIKTIILYFRGCRDCVGILDPGPYRRRHFERFLKQKTPDFTRGCNSDGIAPG